MGCNCGKNAGTVRQARTTTGAAGDSAVRQPRTSMRSRVRFFVAPPPEQGGDELVFDTLYEARAAARVREGWRVESRRVPVE